MTAREIERRTVFAVCAEVLPTAAHEKSAGLAVFAADPADR
jgi:hypothetical protein